MSKKEILPNYENCTESELETVMNALPDQKQFKRLFAIQAVFRGFPPATVAACSFIDRQTLRIWIKKFNSEGIDGLLERPRSGRPRTIPPDLDQQLESVIKNPSSVDQTHWTARKFHGYLREELDMEVGYSTVVKWLHGKGFRLKVPRSWPVKQDKVKREKYIEELSELLVDPDVDIWYMDECGVDGDPRPRRRWVKKEDKAKLPYGGAHLRYSVTGAICPRTGEFFALEFNRSNTQTFQAFLDHANTDMHLSRRRNVLICDNASWHRSKAINWGALEPKFLPPYSPDYNPIERLWLLIKNEWFSDFIAKSEEQLISQLDKALLWAMERNVKNQKTCAI